MLQFQLRADAELYNSCLLFQCNLYTMAFGFGARCVCARHTTSNSSGKTAKLFLLVGNVKKRMFQQTITNAFKVDSRYNFNYCSQFNLKIINFIFRFFVLKNLNYSRCARKGERGNKLREAFLANELGHLGAKQSSRVIKTTHSVDSAKCLQVLCFASNLHTVHCVSTWLSHISAHASVTLVN